MNVACQVACCFHWGTHAQLSLTCLWSMFVSVNAEYIWSMSETSIIVSCRFRQMKCHRHQTHCQSWVVRWRDYIKHCQNSLSGGYRSAVDVCVSNIQQSVKCLGDLFSPISLAWWLVGIVITLLVLHQNRNKLSVTDVCKCYLPIWSIF